VDGHPQSEGYRHDYQDSLKPNQGYKESRNPVLPVPEGRGLCYTRGMTKPIGRPSTWDQHADEMIRLYEDEKKSRGEIARQYGTSVQTVTRVLSRHGVVFEDRQGNANAKRTPEQQAAINAKISASKKGQTYAKKPRERRTCAECGKEVVYRQIGRAHV